MVSVIKVNVTYSITHSSIKGFTDFENRFCSLAVKKITMPSLQATKTSDIKEDQENIYSFHRSDTLQCTFITTIDFVTYLYKYDLADLQKPNIIAYLIFREIPL